MTVPVLQYSSSTSSLTASFPSTSDDSSLPSASPSPGRHVHRRSLTLFSRFPKDLTAFIRPPTHRRNSLLSQSGESRVAKLAFADSTAKPFYKPQMQFQPTETVAPENASDERLARRLERKFYNFLRRSRSRSRPKTDRSESVDSTHAPELPNPATHGQTFAVHHDDLPRLVTTADHSKPPTRVPSRPLSSVTTTTNATILPPTPTQSRLPRRLAPDHYPLSVTPTQGNFTSRPSTSNVPNAHNTLTDVFSNHVPSQNEPSTISFSAEPHALPRFFPVPDVPSNVHDFKSHGHYHTSKIPRPQAPPPISDNMPTTSSKPRVSAVSRLDFFRKPKFFSSSSGQQRSNSTKRSASSPERLHTSHQPDPTTESDMRRTSVKSRPHATHLVRSTSESNVNVHELPKPMPLHGSIPGPSSSPTHLKRSPSSPARQAHSKTIHARLTPAKSVTWPTRGTNQKDSSESKARHVVNRSATAPVEELNKDDKERGRRRSPGTWSARLPSPKFFSGRDREGKGKEKESGRENAVPRERIVIAITHNQERPPTADINCNDDGRRNGNRGVMRSTGVAGNGRIKHGSFDFEKPVWGRGNRTVAESGYSRSKDSLQSGTSNGKQTSTGHSYTTPYSISNQHASPPPTSSPHAASRTRTGSFSSPAPTPSSSLGRANSKRTAGTAKTSVSGVGLSHGPFAFEPVVPSPTRSEVSGPSAKRGGDGSSDSKHTSRLDRRIDRRGQSLDLRLGLAWAPTKVKEEALMPFGRTLSRESTTRQLHLADRKGIESNAGLDVTEAFRKVLSEANYAKFKKYVHRFDAHAIPFDGPSGIVTRIERLLEGTSNLDREGKRDLLDRFVRIILQNA